MQKKPEGNLISPQPTTGLKDLGLKQKGGGKRKKASAKRARKPISPYSWSLTVDGVDGPGAMSPLVELIIINLDITFTASGTDFQVFSSGVNTFS